VNTYFSVAGENIGESLVDVCEIELIATVVVVSIG
jgi:hypothetical protein